jgi:hypothetical protein
MLRFDVSKLLIIAGLPVFIYCAFHTDWLMVPAFAEQLAEVNTIQVEEVGKDKVGSKKISLAEVEKAMALTTERIYWLIGLWVLIILAVVLIRMQLRDDEELYREGYYSKDLE